jgi:hypothetical protein
LILEKTEIEIPKIAAQHKVRFCKREVAYEKANRKEGKKHLKYVVSREIKHKYDVSPKISLCNQEYSRCFTQFRRKTELDVRLELF